MATNLLNSVANMFRPVTAVAPIQPANPMAMQNPGASAGAPAAGTSQPTADAGSAAPSNPLDEFTPLWQTDPNAKPPVDPMAAPLFNADPAAIAAAASKLDMVGQIAPELLAKAMSGQDPASFMAVLNAVAQKTLATATQLNAATIEQATSRNNSRITQALPDHVKRIQLDTLQSENPVLNHPASQPMLQMVRAQVQMKNPGMSAVNINKEAERVLAGFASQLAAPPAAETARAQSAANGTDWDAWASANIS